MSVNKCILVGRLGGDPETRYSASGNPVTNFGLATNEYFKRNGKSEKNTEWHRIVCFGKLAEIVKDNLAKGREVYVEGRIQNRQWKDRDGNDRRTSEIIANIVRFLGSKPQSNGEATPNETNSDDGPQLSSEEE